MDGVGIQADADLVADLMVVRGLNEPLKVAHVHEGVVENTLEDHIGDSGGQMVAVRRDDVDVLGSDDHIHGLISGKALVQALIAVAKELHLIVPAHKAVEDVALADEVGHKGVVGLVIYADRGSDLLDAALVHDHHGVAHGQGLFLVVGHVDKRDAQSLLDAFELILHVFPQPHVQGAQGLVQQQHLGLVHQCPGDGHPLLLSAGQRRDLPVLEAPQGHDLQHLHDALIHLRFRQLADPEPEGDVVVYVQMREQRVFLEYGVDLAAIGRHVVDALPVEKDISGRGRLKAADDPQGCGLAAAAGTEQCEKLVIVDSQVDVVKHSLSVKAHGHVLETNEFFCHLSSPVLSKKSPCRPTVPAAK